MNSSLGDLAVLARMFEEHRPRLLTVAQRRIAPSLAKRIDAEEILQETFLIARQKYRQFRSRSDISEYTWLYRITIDCVAEASRKHLRGRRDLRKEMPWPEESAFQLGAGLIDSATSPSELFARQELRQRVQKALELLSEKDQEILWMRTYDQVTFREVAMVLGISENAATVRYVRALRRLKDIWMRLGHQEEEGR